MLKSLIIHNFIIIDKLEINFSRGYSVLTGETGAGKSIILEALLLTTGIKAKVDLIKENSEKATIIAIYVINNNTHKFLKGHDIEVDNSEVIIRRTISKNGSSKAYINDIQVSLNLLRTLSNFLLDIHGQFDNQILLNKGSHINVLDNFIDKELLSQVDNSYRAYKSALNDYEVLINNINNIASEQKYLSYVLDELEVANVYENEELDLIEKRVLYLDYEKLNEALNEVQSIFNCENNILFKLNQALRVLESIKVYLNNNDSYNNLISKLDKCYSDLLDSEALIQEIYSSLNIEDYDISQIDERLSLIRTLTKKHKVNCNELVQVKEAFKQKLYSLKYSEDQLNVQNELLIASKEVFIKYSHKLSKERLKAAKYLSERVNKELEDLHLNGITFNIEVSTIEENEKDYNALGLNEVYFKFINKLSNESKNINKVASGGELARIMLAIKIALVEKISPSLIILDEIDVGVGGEVAYNIGRKLIYLSNFSQVIAITHSHQVAAQAKYHYKVVKLLDNGISTVVSLLNFENRVLELARMISANEITNDAKAIARKLLQFN